MKKQIILITIFALFATSTFSQRQKKENMKETVEYLVTSEKMCSNCVRKVNNNLPFEKGVTALVVDEEKNTIKVTYRKDRTNKEELQNAIQKLELEVVEVDEEGNRID